MCTYLYFVVLWLFVSGINMKNMILLTYSGEWSFVDVLRGGHCEQARFRHYGPIFMVPVNWTLGWDA